MRAIIGKALEQRELAFAEQPGEITYRIFRTFRILNQKFSYLGIPILEKNNML
jgi:hypothetical protein